MTVEYELIRHLEWIREHFTLDPDGPGVIINGMNGEEVRKWMESVDHCIGSARLKMELLTGTT